MDKIFIKKQKGRFRGYQPRNSTRMAGSGVSATILLTWRFTGRWPGRPAAARLSHPAIVPRVPEDFPVPPQEPSR
jgi:hypothetical protein